MSRLYQSLFAPVLGAVLALLLPVAATAGPVFEIIAPSSSFYAPDVVSIYWGVVTTGSGKMSGEIVFADGFVLPPSGSAAFDASDILSVHYSHTQGALSSPGVRPIFDFLALPGDIVSASGTVQMTGVGQYVLSLQSIETSITQTVTTYLPGGLTGQDTGTWYITGLTAGMHNVNGTGQDRGLTQNSTSPGAWLFTRIEQTGTGATVPEPGSLFLFAAGIVGLGAVRRRLRR